MYGPEGVENVPHREWLKMYDEAIQEVKQIMKTKRQTNQFIGGRVSCHLCFIF
jgi:adenosine deaminase CECR1